MKPLTRSSSAEYQAWQNMHDRCSNKRNSAYSYYGGRGITVCDRWASYEDFLIDMGRRPPNHSLDRINNDKGYSPENCRWATRKQQQNNRSKFRPRVPKPPLKGAKKTMANALKKARERLNENQTDFAARFGLNQATISRWEETGPPTTGITKRVIDMVLAEIDSVFPAKRAG